MGKDVSNKTIVILLALSLIVSISGTMISLDRLGGLGRVTGAAVDTGTGTFNIGSDVSINVNDSAIIFPHGYVNSSCLNAQIRTDGTTFNTGGNAPTSGGTNCWLNSSHKVNTTTWTDGHMILNNGTIPLSVTVAVDSDSNAKNFVCGGTVCDTTTAEIGVKIADNFEATACSASGQTDWTKLADATATYVPTLCAHLEHYDEQDAFWVYLNLTIPFDADYGTARSLTLTYTGSAATT
jgi:hypothetical protein